MSLTRLQAPPLGADKEEEEEEEALSQTALVWRDPGSYGAEATPLAPGSPKALIWRALPGRYGDLTVAQSVFSLTNVIVGAGLLSVPFTFKQSGYVALLVIVGMTGVTCTSGKYLGRCIEMATRCREAALEPPAAWDYVFLARVSVGPRFGAAIGAVTVLELWILNVLLTVLGGRNAAVLGVSPEASMAAAGAVTVALLFVPARVQAYLSLTSTLGMAVCTVAIVAATFTMGHWAYPSRQLGEAAFVRPENIPRSIGIIMFCYSGHPCIPAMKTAMKSPSKWDACMEMSFLTALVYYATFGLLGYLAFGMGLEETIADNVIVLPDALLCKALAAVGCWIKVQCTLPVVLNAIVVSVLPPREGEPHWSPLRVMAALAVAASQVAAALALSHKVAALAALSGNFIVMVTSVIFPAVVYVALAYRFGFSETMAHAEIFEPCFLITFGAVMAIWGTYLAIEDLIA